MHTTSSARFYLQDSRGNTGGNLMFWAQGGGYTSDLARAEAFEEEAAFRQHGSRSSDIPWPVPYLEQNAHRVVDFQYLKPQEAQDWPDQTTFYRQSRSHGFVGNDIIMAANGGGLTTDLGKARLFTREEALRQAIANGSSVFWPAGYLLAKSRLAANARQCNLAAAGLPPGRELIKQRRKVERYKCHSCHIFLKVSDYYGHCPKCGADNRP